MTTKQLAPLIELFLFAAGIDVDVYAADYGVFQQKILDLQLALYEFWSRIV